MDNINDAAAWAVGGTGAVGISFYLLRLAIKGLSSDSVIINNNKADNGIIKRLQDDSARLESIITKQAIRIDDLERKLNLLHDVEIEDAADLAELAVLMESICAEGNDNHRSVRITSIINRLRTRRQKLRDSNNED